MQRNNSPLANKIKAKSIMEMLLKKGGKAMQKPQNTNAGKISLCAKVVNVFISD